MRKMACFLLLIGSLPGWARDWQLDHRKAKGLLGFQTVASPGNQKVTAKAGKNGDAFQWLLRYQAGKLHLAGKMKLDTLSSGNEGRDVHIRENFLNTKRYPEATIKIDPIAFNEDAQTDVPATQNFTGILTLHGASRGIRGVLTSVNKFGTVNMTFDFSVSLPEFGITAPTYQGDTVTNSIAVVARFQHKL